MEVDLSHVSGWQDSGSPNLATFPHNISYINDGKESVVVQHVFQFLRKFIINWHGSIKANDRWVSYAIFRLKYVRFQHVNTC